MDAAKLCCGLLIREEQGLGFKKKKRSARSRTSQIKTDSYYRNARLPPRTENLTKSGRQQRAF